MAGQFMGKELVGQSHPEAGGQRPESRWTDVAHGVSQGSMLGSVLFSAFIRATVSGVSDACR